MPLLFVYGPDALQSRMYDRLGPSDALGGALLAEHELSFDKPPLKGELGSANLKAAPGGEVYGVLYDLTRKQIEMLSGYYGGYVPEDVKVTLLPLAEDHTMDPELVARRPAGLVKATTYLARRTRAGLTPDPAALAATIKGAEENAAPAAFIERLSALGKKA